MDVVGSLADRVTVLHYGEVLAEGTLRRGEGRSARVRGLPGAAREPCSTSTAIHTYYGESHVLHGVSLRVAPGRGGGAARAQRGGQDHADPQHRGLHPAARGRVRLRGTRDRALARATASRGAGIGPGAPGPAHLRPLSVRENLLLGAPRPGGWTLDARLRALPAPARARAPVGRHAVGWRAADARHRPRAADQQPPDPAGRAVGRPGAADRARDRPHPRSRSRRSGCRSCWSSRTITWRCGWPTAST